MQKIHSTLPHRLGAWLFLLLLACQTPPPPLQKGFVWEAKRGDQVVTLIGTMHLGVRKDEIPPIVWQRLQASDRVLIETDADAATPLLLQRYLLLPAGESLKQKLGERDWQRLVALLKKSFPTMTSDQIDRMSPAAAASQLMTADALHADDQGPSMDQTICETAKARGKACLIFETIEEQLSYLKDVFTIAALRDMLDHPEGDDFQALQKAYLAGDQARLEEMITEMPSEMRTILLDRRNEKWISRLDSLLGPKQTLIAVGAAHFGGQKSLLRLMTARGFTIRPLSWQASSSP